MRLKKLELLGFKSFADKTEIAFDQGVTCIVGPNGCGKSNVSDAIRWVLGERSAKLLRGSSMEDVIFNGTEVRQPLAFAEVSLTIDNSDRGLPIDYNEVTIARRLYRTGESEYLLNKTVCRLKDIQDLVLDTGIGSSSYSMIEQGRIDYILRADPEERRFLIEEAAGIAKYKVKKDESIRKLERTEENLKRLNDIVFEVQKNIQYAERQAKRAERYKQELEKLKTLEIKRAFFHKKSLEGKKVELEESFRSKKEILQDLERKIHAEHSAIAEQENRVREMGQRCHEKEGERYQILSLIEKNEQKLQFIRDKRVELAQQRGQLLQEQDQLKLALETSSAKKAEILASVKQQEIDRVAFQEKLETVAQQLKHQEAVTQEVKSALEAVRHNFFEAAQAATQARNEFHRCKALSENLESQCHREESTTSRFAEQITAWEVKLKISCGNLNETLDRLQDLQRQGNELAGEDHVLSVELTNLQKQAHNIRLLLREKESRLRILTEMEHASWDAFQAFLKNASEHSPGLVRGFKEVLKARDGYEWTVDVALGQFVRSVITDDLATARDVIQRLYETKSFATGLYIKGILTTEPLADETRLFYQKIGFRPLADFVETAPGYEELVSNMFVADQFPIQELEQILAYPNGASLLSRDGLFLTKDRRFYFWNDLHRAHFLFSRESEISRLQQETTECNAQVLEVEGHITHAEKRQEALRKTRTEVDQQTTECLLAKESLESAKKNTEERLHALRGDRELISAEVLAMLQEAQQSKTAMEKFRQELISREAEEKKFQHLQEQKEKDLEGFLTTREAILSAFREQQAQLEQCLQGLKHLGESSHLVDQHAVRDQDRLAFLEQGKEKISVKELELDHDEESCTSMATNFQDQLRHIDIELELLRKDRTAQEESLAASRLGIEELLQTQKSLRDQEHQISMQQMDFDYQLKNVGERLAQRYRLELSSFNPQDYLFTEEEMQTAEEVIQGLQTKVDALGTVNLLAIEEYQEMKQRYDFLIVQQKDLEEARDSLMEAIRKINRTTKELFETTFAQVQETFKLYYQTLFRGGDARLVLIDEQHPLESGIDIVVRPPGKKLQNMSLFSGGEKALTAVALLFALFKIRPSPFCLLDEVDAPLDEANIDRFLTVLRSFIDTTQFLIITHNRKTIGMGDSLYGVTMEEPGISKIVSVKVRAGEESLPGELPVPASEEATDTVTT